MADEPDIKPDVPMAIVRSFDDVRALARRQHGELPPNECRFHCMTCGEDKSLEFDEDEMLALKGDPTQYRGPCWKCGRMTLHPYDNIQNGAFRSVNELARENKRREYGEAADVLFDKAKERIGDMFIGMAGGSAAQTDGAAPPEPPVAPAQRDDLPNADDVDISGMKPRQG